MAKSFAGAGRGGDVQRAECAVRECQPGCAAAVAQPMAPCCYRRVHGEMSQSSQASLAMISYSSPESVMIAYGYPESVHIAGTTAITEFRVEMTGLCHTISTGAALHDFVHSLGGDAVLCHRAQLGRLGHRAVAVCARGTAG